MPRTTVRPWMAVRVALAAVAAAFMAAAVTLAGGMVGGYAVHLCGWPARIACDDGTRLWWLVPISAVAVAVAGAGLLVTWAVRKRAIYLTGLAHLVWTAGLFPIAISVEPRTFHWADLVIGGMWGGLGIVLLHIFGIIAAPNRRRLIHWLAGGLWMAYLATLAAVPSILNGLS